MFTPETMQTLKSYAAKLEKPVTIVLQTGGHPKRAELVTFLETIVSTSGKLQLEERDTGGWLRSPVSFALESNGEPTGIVFSGIPGGHEFSSLVLALLHTGGVPVKLDANVARLVGNVDETLQFEVFVSLSCHNCADVVQTLNQFATMNSRLAPNSDFLNGVVELTRYGEVVVNERNETSQPGIFACGDVTTVPYKQIIVAMGEGSKAALAAFEYLLMRAPNSVHAEAA